VRDDETAAHRHGKLVITTAVRCTVDQRSLEFVESVSTLPPLLVNAIQGGEYCSYSQYRRACSAHLPRKGASV
jgi:hypothetical protein